MQISSIVYKTVCVIRLNSVLKVNKTGYEAIGQPSL